MKVATIIYHKNINSLYRKDWIDKSLNSILNQTYTDFIIYEINYGDDNFKICNESSGKEYKYFNTPFNNHAEAMNFLLDECVKDDIDVVFNNNLDDINDLKRFETQLKSINDGYDLVSSNFKHIDEYDRFKKDMIMSNLNISDEFLKEHNIICHPSVCYSKRFIKNNRYVTTEIPQEDFLLWKRTINDFKFYICPEFLLNYRIHNNQITSPKIEPVNLDNINIINNLNSNLEKCICGELKNKVKYNFCQKCSKIY